MNTIYPILKDANGNTINPNLWCKFDTGLITTNDGTDSITLANNNSATNANVYVKGNNAINLNGTNQFLSGTITGIANNSFSVSAWVYNKASAGTVCSFGNILGDATIVMLGYSINGTNTWDFAAFGYSGYTTTSYAGDINNWVFITWTYNNSTTERSIYRNGVKLTLNSSTGPRPSPNTVMQIGAWFSQQNLNGYIDDLRIYKGLVLTQAQILTLYNPVAYSTRDNMQIDETTTTVNNMELIQYPSSFPNNDSIGNIIPERAIDGTIYYVQTFRINNSLYTIKFSSFNESYNKATPLYLFDKNTNNSLLSINNGGSFADIRDTRYDIYTGEYTGNKNYKGTSGEWVVIIFPEQFILKQYGFIAKKGLESCAPGKWSLYADIENPQLIDANGIRLTNRDYSKSNSPSTYIKQIPTNTLKTNSYLFVFQATAQSDINQEEGTKINFIEILLFGTPPTYIQTI